MTSKSMAPVLNFIKSVQHVLADKASFNLRNLANRLGEKVVPNQSDLFKGS